MKSIIDEFGAHILILIWYISGHGGKDYSWTTRRDMVEDVLDSLHSMLRKHPDIAENIFNKAVAMYENHPNEEQIRKYFADIRGFCEGGLINITDLVC